ncbi:MAG TPA: phosphoglycerate mutase family protein [Acidimicrobiales bacterium]|nr:phosphoglycerate mutase family protein [Acidimicrobiales bacterium]
MLLLLLRHGHAGSKQQWHGDDRRRPLSPQGFAEAEALVGLLSPYAPTRIVSSPLLRCIQTVTPLAGSLRLRIGRSKRLVPADGGSADGLMRRVGRGDPGAVVVCTHGEVIHDLQRSLRGDFPTLFGESQPREKGSVWVLERAGGHFVSAEYIAPPLQAH